MLVAAAVSEPSQSVTTLFRYRIREIGRCRSEGGNQLPFHARKRHDDANPHEGRDQRVLDAGRTGVVLGEAFENIVHGGHPLGAGAANAPD